MFVRVQANLDEYSAPIRVGEDFVLMDAPEKLPEHIQQRAIQAAKELAMRFGNAVEAASH
jgi:hypothetical protein